MPHLVESGAFSFRPWWIGRSDAGRAELTDHLMTGEEARELSGLGSWEPRLVPATTPDGRVNEAWMNVERDTIGDLIGMVRASWQPILNATLFKIADDIVDSSEAHYTSAISMLGGRFVAICLELGKHIQIEGDPSRTHAFLGISCGHDGMRPLSAFVQPIRWACWNTVNAGQQAAHRKVTIRHTRGAMQRIEIGEIRRVLGVSFRYLESWEDSMNRLARESMTRSEVVAYLEALMPVNPDASNTTRTENQRDEVLATILTSDNLGDMPLSRYRAYQGTAEWADHGREYLVTGAKASADEARAIAILEGGAEELKDRSYELLAR